MEFKDYYQILNVKPDASSKTIKAAYRKLAHTYHPDMNSDKGAEAKFKEVAEAYQVLKNADTRAEFDELRLYGSHQSKQGFKPPPGWQASHRSEFKDGAQYSGDFSDFFNSIFGGKGETFNQENSHHSRPVRGQDIEIELPVFLEETQKQTEKKVEFRIPADDFSHTAVLKKNLKVKLPKGVIDGERIRLKGQGCSGYNGGQAGDLYLHIRIAHHPLFDVFGHNLTITVPLAPWEAALGTKIMIPTLDGKINLSIPPDTQSGDKLRVKGKGLKSKTATGNLIAIIKVVMPTKTSEKGKLLWQELSTNETFNPRKEWSML